MQGGTLAGAVKEYGTAPRFASIRFSDDTPVSEDGFASDGCREQNPVRPQPLPAGCFRGVVGEPTTLTPSVGAFMNVKTRQRAPQMPPGAEKKELDLGSKSDFQRNRLQTSILEGLGLDFWRFWDGFWEVLRKIFEDFGVCVWVVSEGFRV